MTDSTHTIFQSAKRFFSGTLFSRVTGMLRDMSMAYAFGTQPSVAAFMLAFRFANLLRRLFGEGALQSAFVPEFETLRHDHPNRAFLFFGHLALALALFLILIILLSCLGLGLILQWGDWSTPNQEVLSLTILMQPSLLFICLFGLNASLLQCEKHFFISSVAPALFNVIWIGAVWMLRNTPEKEAMPKLAYGVVFAFFCQWLMTVPPTFALLRRSLPNQWWKSISLYSTDLWRIAKPLSLGILGVAASQINNTMDALFARYADMEGPAFLWYAIRIQQLPLALFGISLAGALLPPLSRSIKAAQWTQYHHFLSYALNRTCLFILPLTAMIGAMGDHLIQIIYGRGDFSKVSILGTTSCLQAYNLGLLPAALVLILAPACYAQKDYRQPALASLWTMLLNALLNSLFILGLGWGAASVALATSISAWTNVFFLTHCLAKKHQRSLIEWSDQSVILKVFFASSLACLGVWMMRFYAQDLPSLSSYSSPFIHSLWILGKEGGCFCILFILIGYCIRLFSPRQNFALLN